MGTRAMVSSGHPLASQAALRVLQEGGNAMDAAITAGGVLAVTKPESCGAGGDAFCTYYDAAADKLESLNCSGRAPAEASLEAYKDGIPLLGPRSASIPGIVRGWADSLARQGTITLSEALSPAIHYAENGFPVSVRLSNAMARDSKALMPCKAAAEAYLKNGRPYQPGEVIKLPDLARSLRTIAEDGPDAFYRGDLARTIASANQEDGGYFTLDDLARQDSIAAEPLSVEYRGHRVFNQRPVSLGTVLLEELKIVEGFDLASLPWDSADRVHLLVEAKKVAFADLETHLTDPDFASVPVSGLLSESYAAQRRGLIKRDEASSGHVGGDAASFGSDTTYLAVVDETGSAVSWIQSVFHGWGSGWMAPGTGILLNNRLTGFSVDPGHVNRLEGGKRTAHTLNAPMVFKDGKLCLVFGTPGSYGQVQSNLQMLTNFVDYGFDIQSMIDAPRWYSHAGRKVSIEGRYSPDTLEALRALGHELDVRKAWTDLMGGAQAIHVNQASGAFEGAADPRREGYAVGY